MPEGVAKVARTELGYPDKLLETSTFCRLVGRRYLSIIVCFSYEEYGQDQNESILYQSVKCRATAKTCPNTIVKYTQKAMGHFCVVMMNAVSRGPIYGDKMIKAAQMLIFRALSWKKNMSNMNIRPPPCATVLKKPFRIRAAIKDSKVVAAAHHAAVAVERTRK